MSLRGNHEAEPDRGILKADLHLVNLNNLGMTACVAQFHPGAGLLRISLRDDAFWQIFQFLKLIWYAEPVPSAFPHRSMGTGKKSGHAIGAPGFQSNLRFVSHIILNFFKIVSRFVSITISYLVDFLRILLMRGIPLFFQDRHFLI